MDAANLIYIAGPCVIEDEALTIDIAGKLKEITAALPLDFVFKASYDKANRTSLNSFRGPGLEEGLRILAEVKRQIGVPVLSDVHDVHDVHRARSVLDYIQIPAFLCRQTDLLVEAARSGKPVNIKKGQFVFPADMRYAVNKVVESGNTDILLTERGSCFGYNNLVVDFRAFSWLREIGYPVVFDATHAVQIPSSGGQSGGHREFVAPLARAAAAYGIDGLFTEVHPTPEIARCDGPNSLHLDTVREVLDTVLKIRALI